MKFPDNHPFKSFEKYFYLESGISSMPIYLFKFGDKGALIEMHFNDKINGPHGRVYEIDFSDEYNFDLNGRYKNIEGNNEESVLEKMALMMEAIKNGKIVRAHS